MSLFTEAEEARWAARRKAVEDQYRCPERGQANPHAIKAGQWDAYWAARESVRHAYQIVRARRIQAKPEPLIEALLVVLANRGGVSINAEAWYADSPEPPDPDLPDIVPTTDQTRRELHTMLKLLRDCPKTWARSAFCRALRGTGSQKDYNHLATGTFGVGTGWKARDLEAATRPLFDGVSGEVFVWYDPRINAYPDEEMFLAAWETDANPFAFALIEKDDEFIGEVLALLDAAGMTPEMKRPVRAAKRKGKQWKPGDDVKAGNIRLLPEGSKVECGQFGTPRLGFYIYKGKGRRKSTYIRDFYLDLDARKAERQVVPAWGMEGKLISLP